MAYFKLALLTSQFEDNRNILLQDIISEFNTQENVYNSKKAEEDPSIETYDLEESTNYDIEKRKYSFCYSYDEKFSLTQNAQKTLTFNMDKFIVREDLREENPFARNIIIGSQLLLVDQYGNNYFFTVKTIDYDIKETNITYKITCQDTFSYQMTRQNAGYTIDNDPTEVDFIGAKTTDWWVINKIIPECHLNYNYLYMNNGLYESTDGSYKVFNYGDNLTDVKRIIKDAYSPDKDKDLYETIPFSCSGSNANAALISLGETLDLQLKTFEHTGQQLLSSEKNALSSLSDNYILLNYIENTAQNYVNTGYKPNNTTKIEMEISISSFTPGAGSPPIALFGARELTQDMDTINNFNVWMTSTELAYQYCTDGTDWERYKILNHGIGVGERFEVIADRNICQIIKGTTTRSVATAPGIFQCDRELQLFTVRTSNNLDARMAKMKLYSCKIWDKDILKRDFIPVIKKDTGTIGLYDRVEQTFYPGMSYPGTNTNFVTPSVDIPTDYLEVEYIESTGATPEHANAGQYIDTGIIPDSNTEIEMTFAGENLKDEDIYVFGAGGTAYNNNSYELYPWHDGAQPLLSYWDFNFHDTYATHSSRIHIQEQLNTFSLHNRVVTYKTNGKITGTLTIPQDKTTNPNLSLCLFALHRNSVSAPNSIQIGPDEYVYVGYKGFKLYACKIWNKIDDTLTLVRDFIPVIRKSDRKPGLYDRVNNKFYSNANQYTDFIAGGIKTEFDPIRYFWFEPKKNTNRIGGLVYSPYNSIQSFGLSHKGDSLTTILNVEGPTYDDELITLIPELTPHFSNFINDISWADQYKEGMFLAQCEPQHYMLNDKLDKDAVNNSRVLYYTKTWTGSEYATVSIEGLDFEQSIAYDPTTGYLYLELFSDTNDTKFKLNPLFTRPTFNSGGVSSIIIKSSANPICPSDKHRWSLVLIRETGDIEKPWEEKEFLDGEDMSDYIDTNSDTNTSVRIKIFIGRGLSGTLSFTNFEPNLAFYRDVSQEDLDFAKAAEECPWLENKLIDFTYFLENSMITSDEYRNLLNLLTQDLRIINGKLMFHAKAYYEALHKRTKLLADLTNQLDVLGAAANADIVTTLRTAGQITEDTDTHSFHNAYQEVVLSNIQDEDKQKLLNYDDILTNYYNKFFNSEQRFLKNIKKFKDYFESVPTTWLDPATGFYDYTVELINYSSGTDGYIINDAFNENNLTGPIEYIQAGDQLGVPIYQIYYATGDDKGKPYYPITIENFNNYYIKNGDGSGKEIVKTDEQGHPTENYNTVWTYYDSNDALVDYTTIRSVIIQNQSNHISYRNSSPEYITFANCATYALPSIKAILGEDSDWDTDYKWGFTTKEIILSNPGEDDEVKISLINEDNDDNFYKLNINKKWKKNPNKIRYDIYGHRQNGDRNFIYGSSTTRSSPYKESDEKTTVMGANFLFAASNSSYCFKNDTFFRAVSKDQKLSKTGTYKVFEIQDGYNVTDNTDLFRSGGGYRSNIAYWPIYELFEDCDLIGEHKKQVESLTIEQLLNIDYATPQTGSDRIWVKKSGGRCPFEKPFIIVQITDYRLTECNSSDPYDRSKTYCDANDNVIDFNDYLFPIDGVHYHRIKPYIHPSESNIASDKQFSLTGEYYKQDSDEEYTRIYTVQQLNSTDFKTLARNKTVHNYLTPYETKMIVPLQKVTYTRNEDNQITNFVKTKTEDYTIYFTEGEVHSTPAQYYNGDNDTPIGPENTPYPTIVQNTSHQVYQTIVAPVEKDKVHFKLTKHYQGSITAKTNGDLWYQCTRGELSDTSYAVNIAAAIEAELEQSWQQAYTASLYCRYFLPESWQMTYDKDQNLFSDDIIGTKGSSGNISVYLKSTYIPTVSIYSLDGKTVLPKYYITRGQRNEYQVDDKSIDSDSRIDASIFAVNPVINEFITYLGENSTSFSAAESGTTTYYYIANKDKGTGCTWSQLMLRKVGTEYTDYSGHYDLAYRLIKKNYLPLVLTEYETLKYQKQVLWDTLYRTYGYLMLEQNYKNDTATNSSELMTLAKYAFKDYSAPERQYNITVIDATSLKGYKGDEIRIGDGIQIDAQAYYNEYDQIFKSLSQYLFITDISYTLRSPTDISLTVNSIKYQDKLIQRLVKLIK